ncbi:hypothetical protein, partial [Kitasatospora sp. LaBMicrA B282]|uniref:hypothetical protein n=1 Tax=Kitasatospora sp. LaBMicrA B282 TaxID=3420949 RepID=UPI003D11237C
MTRHLPRLPRLLAAAALSVAPSLCGAGLAATPAAADALPMDQCTPTSGVVLAVDFGPWGGPVLRACGSTPTTGFALLNEGGWRTTGTHHDGPGFICRIAFSGFRGGAGFPTPDQDACVSTPPIGHYWSYWHADPGQQSWSYSQLGAATYQPAPGSVDAWVYGGTDVDGSSGGPSFAPDSVRAHNPVPVPSSSPSAPAGSGGNPPPGGGGNPQPPVQQPPAQQPPTGQHPPGGGTTGGVGGSHPGR